METLENVESALYGHMVRSAFKGFLTAAAVAGAVGAAVGALLFGVFGLHSGFIPQAMMDATGNSAALAGTFTTALAFATTAGTVGAVAGIQSARDARRYMRIHEADRDDALLPPEQDIAAAATPELEAARKVSYRERLEAEAKSPLTPAGSL